MLPFQSYQKRSSLCLLQAGFLILHYKGLLFVNGKGVTYFAYHYFLKKLDLNVLPGFSHGQNWTNLFSVNSILGNYFMYGFMYDPYYLCVCLLYLYVSLVLSWVLLERLSMLRNYLIGLNYGNFLMMG